MTFVKSKNKYLTTTKYFVHELSNINPSFMIANIEKIIGAKNINDELYFDFV